MLQQTEIRRIIERALREDIGSGDVTTESVLTGRETGIACAMAKEGMVVAGVDVFKEVFLHLDPEIRLRQIIRDGQQAKKGDIIAELSGSLKVILQAERVALNLLQRMCGIATMTCRFVREIKGTGATLLDTRKTAPGLRRLDKYAVTAGGGRNHRFALYDGVLIKDNHIAAAGGIARAVKGAKASIAPTLKIEVEVRNMKEVREALNAGADMIMLDNMGIGDMRRAVRFIAGRVPVEASGNISLRNAREVAMTGVDYLSVGLLTHSVTAADISLMIHSVRKKSGKK